MATKDNEIKQNDQPNQSKRQLVRLLTAAGMATGSANLATAAWMQPVVRTVATPAHAATSEIVCTATLEGEGDLLGPQHPDNNLALSVGETAINLNSTDFYPNFWNSGPGTDPTRLGITDISATLGVDQDVMLTTQVVGDDLELSNGDQTVTAIGGVANFSKVFLQNSNSITVDSGHTVTMTLSSEGFTDCVYELTITNIPT